MREGAEAVREAGLTLLTVPQSAGLAWPRTRTLHALHVQVRCSSPGFPASVMLRLAPCPGAASSRALPHARECVILAARTSRAGQAPAACRGLGKARGSLQKATPTGWVAFSCRAPFHGYKVFSPQTRVREVHRQAWRSRTGRQGAWIRAWEYQEVSQGTGMRKSEPKLGMDTWRLERGGSSSPIRGGISQGCTEMLSHRT